MVRKADLWCAMQEQALLLDDSAWKGPTGKTEAQREGGVAQQTGPSVSMATGNGGGGVKDGRFGTWMTVRNGSAICRGWELGGTHQVLVTHPCGVTIETLSPARKARLGKSDGRLHTHSQ